MSSENTNKFTQEEIAKAYTIVEAVGGFKRKELEHILDQYSDEELIEAIEITKRSKVIKEYFKEEDGCVECECNPCTCNDPCDTCDAFPCTCPVPNWCESCGLEPCECCKGCGHFLYCQCALRE